MRKKIQYYCMPTISVRKALSTITKKQTSYFRHYHFKFKLDAQVKQLTSSLNMFTKNFHLSLLQYAINKVDDYRRKVDSDSVVLTFPFNTLELF